MITIQHGTHEGGKWVATDTMECDDRGQADRALLGISEKLVEGDQYKMIEVDENAKQPIEKVLHYITFTHPGVWLPAGE
jgi:hypothetical protein